MFTINELYEAVEGDESEWGDQPAIFITPDGQEYEVNTVRTVQNKAGRSHVECILREQDKTVAKTD